MAAVVRGEMVGNVMAAKTLSINPGVLDNGIEHYFSMSTFSCF